MKPSRVKAALLKRLAYLEIFVLTKGSDMPSSTLACIHEEADALRHALGHMGLLDEGRLEELRDREKGRSLNLYPRDMNKQDVHAAREETPR